MAVEKVYLIRHGETEWNITGRWQGILDPPLNEPGRKQAEKLAAHLKDTPIQAIYSSDLSRAFDTAKMLGDALGLSLIVDKRLRELHIGVFQGLTKPEIIEKYPEEFEAFMAQPFEHCITEGESRRQLQARVLEAWQELTARKDIQEIAIITHGGAIKTLLSALFPQQKESFDAQDFPNVSITLLERTGDNWRIAELANTSHLNFETKEKGDDTLYF